MYAGAEGAGGEEKTEEYQCTTDEKRSRDRYRGNGSSEYRSDDHTDTLIGGVQSHDGALGLGIRFLGKDGWKQCLNDAVKYSHDDRGSHEHDQ